MRYLAAVVVVTLEFVSPARAQSPAAGTTKAEGQPSKVAAQSAPGKPLWLEYFATFTGAFGTLSGLSGALLALRTYRRTAQTKALDLRVDLRKSIAGAEVEVADLLNEISSFRRAVLFSPLPPTPVAASAEELMMIELLSKSWTLREDQFKTDVESHIVLARDLQTQLGKSTGQFARLTQTQLETKIADAARISKTIQLLTARFRNCIDVNAKARLDFLPEVRALLGS